MNGNVVVTGASSGIGRACALELDRRGYRVFAGVRRAEDGQALQADARDLIPLTLDVTDEASVRAAARTVRTYTGTLDGLVNNAGISIAGPLELLPLDELRRQLEINVVGLLAVTQAFLPLLRSGRGRIVNIGSVSGLTVLPFLGAYAASKHAVEALTDALRMELRPWGIAVSVIEPGRVATPLVGKTRDRSRQLMADATPGALELYGPIVAAMARLEVARPAMPVDQTVKAVVHAITARRPKTRYLVGADARQRRLLQLLPDRLRDRVILRQIST